MSCCVSSTNCFPFPTKSLKIMLPTYQEKVVQLTYNFEGTSMDAYDIFKKLTKGAKFKRQRKNLNLVKIDNVNSPKNEESSNVTNIYNSKNTNEILNLNSNLRQPNSLDESLEIKIEYDSEEELEAKQESNTLTLLGSMVVEENPKKGKKRKREGKPKNEKIVKLLEQEKTNHFRNLNQIKTVGSHVPDPIQNFEDLKIDSDLIKNLVKCGYSNPTAVQKQAITVMLENRNLLACAPTGSGKTAAFSIPIIQLLGCQQNKQGIKALVICPTRELAKQTQREFLRLSEGRNIKIHVINKVNNLLTPEKSKHLQKYDVLVTTPNRLCFLLTQDKPLVSLTSVQWLIIDEADKLFEVGTNGFRKQLQQILSTVDLKQLKIGMFSATHTPVVAKWCLKNMKGLIRVTVGQRNAATDMVHQELLFVGNEAGKLLAFRDLVKKGLSPPVLVFVQSKERAQQLFTELIYDGINVAVIHANQTQLQRDNTVKSFREGNIWVLICTDLMGRGVDFKGVNLVINYDFPTSAISYVHRIGRAGRAGREGKAITYFTVNDTVNLRSIAHVLKQSGCDVPDYMLLMKKRSKTEKKKLEKAAPKRDDISIKPSKRIKLDNLAQAVKRKTKNGIVRKGSESKKKLQKSKKNKLADNS